MNIALYNILKEIRKNSPEKKPKIMENITYEETKN